MWNTNYSNKKNVTSRFLSGKNIYRLFLFVCCASCIQLALTLSGCSSQKTEEQKPTMTLQQMEERGKYLVDIGSCTDCHSPKIMTKDGPVPDTTPLLSASPPDINLPPINASQTTPAQ